jgi:BirA family transcriptional regulator, biotin operon repressor / biotin---[acetyl-CoA-carboxylase] ligase
MIDPARIRNETFVQSLTWLEEVGSTNTHLLESISGGESRPVPPLPLLLGADRQTRGRGRGRNAWWAAEGALTFSLLLQPERYGIPISRWPLLSLATGLAIRDALDSHLPGISLQVKWPNDVYADGRKLCGILIETATLRGGREGRGEGGKRGRGEEGTKVTEETKGRGFVAPSPSSPCRPVLPSAHPSPGPTHLVIGVGVNVNNSLASAPEEVRLRAVSMQDLLGRSSDLTDVLRAILRELEGHLRRFDTEHLVTRWRSRCYLTGKCVTIVHGPDAGGGESAVPSPVDQASSLRTTHGQETTGTCLGIDEEGALRLLTPAGEQRFHGGTVRDA